MAHAENDAEFHDYLSAFREGLQKLGWTEGRSSSFEIIDNFGFVLSEIQLKVEKHAGFA